MASFLTVHTQTVPQQHLKDGTIVDHSDGKEGSKEVEEARTADDEMSDTDDELVELPEEVLRDLGEDRIFESPGDLDDALMEIWYRPFVWVDGKPRRPLPSRVLSWPLEYYPRDFEYNWSYSKWGYSQFRKLIFLQDARWCYADIAIRGHPRCSYKCSHICREFRIKPSNWSFSPIPDAVVQFVWKKRRAYKIQAINDMMNRGLEVERGQPSKNLPRVGYLIEARFSKKRKRDGRRVTKGLDIYRLTHGTTVADACDRNNPNAQHLRYVSGGPEVFITIKAEELGITGFGAWLCGDYTMKASKLFQDLTDR